MSKSNAKPRGLLASSWRQYRRSKLALFGLTFVVVMFLTAFFSPMLANEQPIVCKYEGKLFFPAIVDTIHQIPFASSVIKKDKPFRLATFNFKESFDPTRGDWAWWAPVPYGPLELAAGPFEPPSAAHRLGTDEVGRDVLARMIHGSVISVKVGFISMGLAVFIGLCLGGLAGYFGGWVDMLISRFIEIVMCFPTFFLILAILAFLEPRIENVMIVIGLTGWTGIARYARAEYIRQRNADYVSAMRVLGASNPRIIFRHLLPNSLAPVMVSVTFGIASAILAEAGLSWLGFGVQPPTPSWGSVLKAGYDNLRIAPYLIQPPCVAIFAAVLAFNLVGDRLRDVTDPRLRSGH